MGDGFDQVMIAQIFRDGPGACVSPLHPGAQGFQRPADQPAAVRIELGAEQAAQLQHRRHQIAASRHRAGDQVAVTR